MALSAGFRLGPYEILGAIGAGGMGEVYRARDTKLNRDVALKVLPDAFTRDPDRLARFRREAQVLASLNHPNIAAVYGFEDSSNVHAFVMELVDGDDLSAHIARGPMALAEALPIARQIADALEAAHEQGIIHRDLKPANIKVRADGTVKVLDFGLAKAFAPEGANATADATNSPTLTVAAHELGMILGTAAYMAPEQARGRAVDRRADIWAFGVVLYEMLTGRRAFEGDDVSITLANVLKEDVDWQSLPDDIPVPIRRLLRRCLEKDPKRRLSAIGDARLEIDEAADPTLTRALELQGLPRARIVKSSLVATALWLAAVAVLLPRPRPLVAAQGRARPQRIQFELPSVGDTGAGTLAPQISPDGRTIAFVSPPAAGGPSRIWVRALDSLEARSLDGTEGGMYPVLVSRQSPHRVRIFGHDQTREPLGRRATGALRARELRGRHVVGVRRHPPRDEPRGRGSTASPA